MFNSLRLAVPGTAFCFLLLTSTANATSVVLFEDDFSGESPVMSTGGPGYDILTDLTFWTVEKGNVDAVAPGAFGCPSDPCIDLDGSFSSAPAIMTTLSAFDFESGHEYNLQVDIPTINPFGGGGDDAFEITIGSLFSYVAPDSYSSLFIDAVFTAGSDASEKITIEMFDAPDNFGPYLTRVSLSKLGEDPDRPEVIPLPAGLPLLLGALGLTGLTLRKRRS